MCLTNRELWGLIPMWKGMIYALYLFTKYEVNVECKNWFN